jgi:hypothetical protein
MSLWKIKIGLRLVQVELRATEDFHRQADAAFRTQLSALETEYQSRPSAYWNKSSELGITRGEELGERRDEIDGLLDLNEYFGVITVHAAFDHFLFRIFEYAKSQGLIKCRYYAKKPFLMFSKSVDMLKDEFAIDLRQSPFDWNRIEELTTVRNAIAHKGGWIAPDPTSEEFRKFKAYGFPSTWPLELPKGYFLQSKTLVLDTCRAIARKFVKYAQQGSPRALP